MNRDHGQHILVLRAKTHKDADTSFDGIGTFGWAAKFWNERDIAGSPANLIKRAFIKSFTESNFVFFTCLYDLIDLKIMQYIKG